MNENTRTVLLILIGWAIYRYLKGEPLLPTDLRVTDAASGELTHEEEWEVVRTPEGGVDKVVHRWK